MPLYKSKDNPDVYYRPEEGGPLQHITSPEEFAKGGFKWGDVTEIAGPAFQNLASSIGIGKPWSAADIAQGEGAGEINLMPQKPFDLGTSSDRIAAIEKSTQQYLDFQMKQAEAEAKQRAELMKEQRSLGQKLKEGMLGGPSIAELQQQQLEKGGIPEMIKQQQTMITEIGELRKRLDDLNAQERQQLATSEERAVSTRVIGREEARIKETFSRQRAALSAELSSKAAVLQAQRGLLSDARSLAEQTVKALVYDQEQKVAGLQYFFENNQSLISGLDKGLQNSLKEIMDVQQTELGRLRDEKEKVMTLALQYPRAGITPDMSVEEAAQMAITYAPTEEREKTVRELALKYPLANIEAGDDIDTAIAKAQKVASERERLELEKVRADIARTRQLATGETGGTANMQDWVNMILAGQADISNVPSNLRNQVVSGLATSLPDPTSPDWVSDAWRQAQDAGDSDETIEEDLRKMGVPRAVIEQVRPEVVTSGGSARPITWAETMPYVSLKPVTEAAKGAWGKAKSFLRGVFLGTK